MRRMFRLPCVCLCALALSLLAAAAAAQPVDDATATNNMPAPQLTEEGRFAAAITGSDEAFRAELARLTELFHQAGTPEESLAVQRQISALKQNWEIELLEIQLRFAREAGRETQVQELEAVIAQAKAVLPEAAAGARR